MEYHGAWWTGIEHKDFRKKTYDISQHKFMGNLKSDTEVFVDALTEKLNRRRPPKEALPLPLALPTLPFFAPFPLSFSCLGIALLAILSLQGAGISPLVG
eukprot:770152-Amphidinium_carterae.2